MPSPPRILIYLLRRDLRLADNPVLHEIAKAAASPDAPFTHLLPLYVFSCAQIEVSGFLRSSTARSPFPEARSPVAGFWRCGPHRATFLAESVWELKSALGTVGSGLEIRVGRPGEVVREIVEGLELGGGQVAGVWMTNEEGQEEKEEERDIQEYAKGAGKEFRRFLDEKYLVDDRDLPFRNPQELPDVFTSFRKSVEPLHSAARPVLPTVRNLPPLPPAIPAQSAPFKIPHDLPSLTTALLAPLHPSLGLSQPPKMPMTGAASAHPFRGGSSHAHARLAHLLSSGAASSYAATRNEMLGTDGSTKFSAWLALGCITARQIDAALGEAENPGTRGIRFELLWRDYMRLCARKFGVRLFRLWGFRGVEGAWKSPASAQPAIARFLEGRTGMGLVDASMRELFLTGYTSNRARQNVASFLAQRLGIDWRVGAEWYECTLVDYDVSSNWGNWQYVAGVGNDPRGGGEGRVFNQVKQGHDYDLRGEYMKSWVEELRPVKRVEGVWSAWVLSERERAEAGLKGLQWVEEPLVKIQWGGKGGGKGKRQGGRKPK
ncbi:hypothetical protein PLICRDRAFT_52750 [Plicaturopsis crispa FD-325 SS-3]|nr:hypothetical protein PLICRDRAFT_52750 [Plicaturopsis crispa FD-325 SS-3]